MPKWLTEEKYALWEMILYSFLGSIVMAFLKWVF